MPERLTRLLRKMRLPPWMLLLSVSALLFLAGSASFGLSGAQHAAEIGVVGAIAALAVIVAFSG